MIVKRSHAESLQREALKTAIERLVTLTTEIGREVREVDLVAEQTLKTTGGANGNLTGKAVPIRRKHVYLIFVIISCSPQIFGVGHKFIKFVHRLLVKQQMFCYRFVFFFVVAFVVMAKMFDCSGVKPVEKREGGGPHNWGSHKDIIE